MESQKAAGQDDTLPLFPGGDLSDQGGIAGL